MKKLLTSLAKIRKEELPYEPLGKWIRQFDFANLDYKEYLPKEICQESYSRNIITLEPLECVILYWLPNQESAIHFHEGFWGYVAVLEGEAKDVEYKFEDGKLIEYLEVDCRKGGIIQEPDGAIHKIVNASSEKPLVTAHFYAPALEDFNGMKIYDVENCSIGTLNQKALSASWDIPKEHFSEIEENAFEFVPINKVVTVSHRIHPIIPKPNKAEITELLKEYYDEQAHVYDCFDTAHKSRNAYTNAINELIVNDISKNHSDIKTHLALACGTGRRELQIKEQTGFNYEITGLDISVEMCCLASERGLKMLNNDWLDAELPEESKYDIVTFLYAFGHLSSKDERLLVLEKIRKHLKKGGTFYFDVFNVKNTNEWGPKAHKFYKEFNLQYSGYEDGDVFYKKTDGKATAYLHYFNKSETEELLKEAGFKVDEIHIIGYAKNSGEITQDITKGNLFIKAVVN